MPGIDNRAIWDKGIGPAAETIFSSSAPATMSGTPTNYNTGAWSQDQTVQPPTTTTPSQPSTPATSTPNIAQGQGPAYNNPAQGSGQPNQAKPGGRGPYAKNIEQAGLKISQLQQKLQLEPDPRRKRQIEADIRRAVDDLHRWQTANQKYL